MVIDIWKFCRLKNMIFGWEKLTISESLLFCSCSISHKRLYGSDGSLAELTEGCVERS